jgi:hypothetical protein
VRQHFRLPDHRFEDFNRMKILIIEQNCLWNDFIIPFDNLYRRAYFVMHTFLVYFTVVLQVCCKLMNHMQMLFTFLSAPFVASNTLVSLSSPSTNAWMDTEVTLQKRHFFLWAHYIKIYCFLLIPSGCKTRSSLIQNLSRFSRWKSLHRQFCSMMRIFILWI